LLDIASAYANPVQFLKSGGVSSLPRRDALLKRIRILENHSIQFRTEFFNAFNHTQFSNPNYGVGATYALPNVRAGNFGQITSTSVNPRVIQFALKYSF